MTATQHTIDTAVRVARHLYHRPAPKKRLCVTLGVSGATIQRALTWLRDEAGAPLNYDRVRCRWSLARGWRLPAKVLPPAEIVRQLRSMLGEQDVLAAVEGLMNPSTRAGVRAMMSRSA